MRMWPLLVMVLLASIGQVLLKLSVSGRGAMTGIRDYLGLLTNFHFIAGISLYILTTIGWMWALKTFPLSKAYPVLALSFVVVPLLAWYFFGEKLNATHILGMALILVGVSLIGVRV